MAVYREEGEEVMLLDCPYDRSHKIAPRRQQFHVKSCPSQFKSSASCMTTCRYNSGHIVRKDQMDLHLSRCPDFRSHLRHQVQAASAPRPQTHTNDRQISSSATNSDPRRQASWDRESLKRPLGYEAREQSNKRHKYMDLEKPFDWKSHCFRPDGGLIQPLGTLGLSRLNRWEKSEYYKMLQNASNVRLAEWNQPPHQMQVFSHDDPVDGSREEEDIDWTAGSRIGRGFML